MVDRGDSHALALDGSSGACPGRGVGLARVATAPAGSTAVQQAGGQTILEYWIPAEDLEDLNPHIVGPIEVVAELRPSS